LGALTTARATEFCGVLN